MSQNKPIPAVDLLQEIEITKVGPDGSRTTIDVVVPEYALHLSVNRQALATLMCLPEALHELVVGFLVSEGLVRRLQDIDTIEISQANGEAAVALNQSSDLPLQLYGRRTINTGCDGPPLFPRTLDSLRSRALPASRPITVASLSQAMQQLHHRSQLFEKSGGVHSAALCRDAEILFFREDVGRHNAVDKVAGEAVLNGVIRSECALLCSGRISTDLITKAAIHGIPVVASRSAPTGRAVEIARSLNVGLAGFVRGRRMNIYAAIERFDLCLSDQREAGS